MKITMKRAAAGAVLLAALALAFLKVFAPPKVAVAKPGMRVLVQEVFGTGTVEARVLVNLGSKITGRVRELRADEGDRVIKGQVLAVLESDDLEALARQSADSWQRSVSMAEAAKKELARARARLEAGRAALSRSMASLKLASVTRERYSGLYEKGMVSRQDIDEKTTAWEEARMAAKSLEAELAVAEAEVGMHEENVRAAVHESGSARAAAEFAEERLKDTVVTSSIDGVVVSRESEEGDAVLPGSALFRIADPDTVWVGADIDESRSGGIALGSPARVILRSRRDVELPGEVARVSQESDRVTEELKMYVAYPLEDQGQLHLGEQAEVYVRGIERQCLSVPAAAVTVRDGAEGVFIEVDGRARFVPVTTGIWAGPHVEVLQGIDAGDRVVLIAGGPGRKLTDGMRIRAEEVPAHGGHG